MRIALDAMGGDYAPAAIVQGGLEAAKLFAGQCEIVFVGDQTQIEQEIARHPILLRGKLSYSIQHASEKIEMADQPTVALKKKDTDPLHRRCERKAMPSFPPAIQVRPWLPRC
jgi:glycerol-3-phosphate acyltransferase PlsX